MRIASDSSSRLSVRYLVTGEDYISIGRSTGADTADGNLADNSSMARVPLTSMQRYVLMQWLEGKPGAEAAAMAGVSRQAIYKRAVRARKRMSNERLKRYLEAFKGVGGRRRRVRVISLSCARE